MGPPAATYFFRTTTDPVTFRGFFDSLMRSATAFLSVTSFFMMSRYPGAAMSWVVSMIA